MRLLVKSGARTVLSCTSDWHVAEKRRLLDLEFFNKIGRCLPPGNGGGGLSYRKTLILSERSRMIDTNDNLASRYYSG